ncbi:MAG: hypothetical protein J6Y74_03530 [Clostridia bacterium]|nr:hypothetical protein [Clostridia bacterium]
MKNGFFMALALAVWGALKLLFKGLKIVVEVLTSLVMFLGLYIPLFYVLFGLILLAATDFTFGGMGVNQILYYIGLALSCVAAVIISVRNLLVRPFSGVFKALRGPSKDRYDDEDGDRRPRRGYDDEDERRGEYGDRRRMDPYREGRPYDRGDFSPRDPYREDDGMDPYEEDGFSAPYGERAYEGGRYPREPRGYGRGDLGYPMPASEGERPLVYYSKRRPGVLVKEYSDRFELFREDASGRTYIGTEYKED